jgi:hypothetical protein
MQIHLQNRLIYDVDMKILVLFVALMFVIFGVACSERSQTSTPAPTATFPLSSPTPTPWVIPTKTIANNLTAEQLALYGVVSLKGFPTELENSSPVLDQESALESWYDFLGDSVVVAGVDTVLLLCEAEVPYGRWHKSSEGIGTGFEGIDFNWGITFGVGDRWNSPRLVFSIDPFTISNQFAANLGDEFAVELRAPSSDGSIRWHGLGGNFDAAFTRGDLISVWDSNSCG